MEIAKCHQKKMVIITLPIGIFNLIKCGVLNKIFGSLTYSIDEELECYAVEDFQKTIQESEAVL